MHLLTPLRIRRNSNLTIFQCSYLNVYLNTVGITSLALLLYEYYLYMFLSVTPSVVFKTNFRRGMNSPNHLHRLQGRGTYWVRATNIKLMDAPPFTNITERKTTFIFRTIRDKISSPTVFVGRKSPTADQQNEKLICYNFVWSPATMWRGDNTILLLTPFARRRPNGKHTIIFHIVFVLIFCTICFLSLANAHYRQNTFTWNHFFYIFKDQWKPSESAHLCEVHFEDNQFEKNRVDGWIKLKWDAVPTIFNIPNPPKRPMTTRRPRYKKPITVEDNVSCQIPDTVSVNADTSKNIDNSNVESCINCHEYVNEIAQLKKQVEILKKEIAEKKIALKQFLTDQQINSLKICFAVGVHGFQYLRQINFPLPYYSTITEPLVFKVQQLEKKDRFCVLSFDEMEISKRYGKSKTSSKLRKTSITKKKNKDKKYDYLQKLTGLVEQTDKLLFCNGFDFLLCHRQTPNAIQSLRALRMILMSQYISDNIKHSSYMDDSDEFLLNHFKKVPENFNSTSIDIFHPTKHFWALKILPEYDMNIVLHLAGSATNAILKVSCN
ncbi:hypothetical protein QTP88_007344 [Uroleucon formosanum]